jgi:hypothetical protein
LLLSERSILNRKVLSMAPMRGLGLVSYSWYLWHWPLMAFTRISSPLPPSSTTLFVVALIALFIAILSWRFVEQPFRRATQMDNAMRLRRYGVALLICCALPLCIVALNGLPARFPAAAAHIQRTVDEGRAEGCLAPEGTRQPDISETCWSSGAGPRLVVLGDSHAAVFGEALRGFARAHDIQFGWLTKTSCPPLSMIAMQAHPSLQDECSAFNESAIASVVNDPDVKWVVLAGYWEAGLTPSTAEAPLRADALRRTAERFSQAGKIVVILGDVPRFRFNPIRQAIASYLPAREFVSSTLFPEFRLQNGWAPYSSVVLNGGSTEHLVANAAASGGAMYLGVQNALCGPSGCRVSSANGDLYYIDTQHLSRAGAEFVLAQSGLARILSTAVARTLCARFEGQMGADDAARGASARSCVQQ